MGGSCELPMEVTSFQIPFAYSIMLSGIIQKQRIRRNVVAYINIDLLKAEKEKQVVQGSSCRKESSR
jgi:hypothetical protein